MLKHPPACFAHKLRKKNKVGSPQEKAQKNSEEQTNHPNSEIHEDIFEQDLIIEEVRSFYHDLYKARTTNPDYEEIVNALGPAAIKKLSDLELRRTEMQITMTELTHCLSKTRNNTAPGASGFTGSFYKVFWSKIKFLVLQSVH